MKDSTRKRREQVFKLLVVKGYDYAEVVDKLAESFDVARGTVKRDINEMEDWLPEIARYDDDNGVAKILELRRNRQRLQQLATEARQEGETAKELSIRRSIEKSVLSEAELAQSLGIMQESADKHEVEHSGGLNININHDHVNGESD
mgnify:CR=1 FL=1